MIPGILHLAPAVIVILNDGDLGSLCAAVNLLGFQAAAVADIAGRGRDREIVGRNHDAFFAFGRRGFSGRSFSGHGFSRCCFSGSRILLLPVRGGSFFLLFRACFFRLPGRDGFFRRRRCGNTFPVLFSKDFEPGCFAVTDSAGLEQNLAPAVIVIFQNIHMAVLTDIAEFFGIAVPLGTEIAGCPGDGLVALLRHAGFFRRFFRVFTFLGLHSFNAFGFLIVRLFGYGEGNSTQQHCQRDEQREPSLCFQHPIPPSFVRIHTE